MTIGKTIALTRWTFVGKVMSLLFNILSMLVIAFLPRRKHLNFMAAVTICSDFGAQENKICNCLHFCPSIWHEVMGPDAKILVFWKVSFKPAFHFPLSHSSRSSLVPLYFLPLKWYYLHIWSCWYFSWQSWFQLVIHQASYFTWYILHILNKLGDNIQPFCTSLPILAQSVVHVWV